MADKNNKEQTIMSFQTYLSNFFYAFAILFFLIAAYFMLGEPVGASMLSFDMSLILVVFAILYGAATITGELVLKFISKYLVLIGFMITAYQFMTDYGYLSTLQLVFAIAIAIFLVVFIFDFLMYFKDLLEQIWDSIRKKR